MIAKKKNKKVDLEGKRFAFFQIGLVVAGSLCLAAFEYSTVQLSSVQTEIPEGCELAGVYEEPMVEHIVEAQPQKKQAVSVIIDQVKVVDKVIKTTVVSKIDVVVITDPEDDDSEGIPGVIIPHVDSTYEFVQTMPEFPGGFGAMHKWIGENINLPHYAESLNGVVYVRFVVGKDGSISKVTLTKGIHSDYDKASLAVVQKMPKWTPGEQAGKKVNVRYDLPIKFVNR
jgi:protein TonB